MPLPINIEDLLQQRKIESNRIEFKAGWNPDKIYHTICAFATDLENIGGGYILVGVEEDNGIARRPVKGLPPDSVDRILREMVSFDAKISPSYMTKVSVETVDGKTILVIWTPTGLNRPYSVMESVVAKRSVPKFYVRSKSSTIEAKGEILDQIRALANRIPFDEQGNPMIGIDDISAVLVYDYLKNVKSKLADDFATRPFIETLDAMNLTTGPTENRQIKNVAAMMFCDNPEKFFPVTMVRIGLFPDGAIENPDSFIEIPPIKGPVPKMIAETLSYIRTNLIKQKITKPAGDEKSIRIFNYPYQAFEEAVVNALYHRDYQEREPVEITIEPDHVDILSYSGPDRSISAQAIKEARRLKARRYRNRMLGDFLKELSLTEGWATGIPTIQRVLGENGSAPAVIETDDDRTYFLMTIPCRSGFEDTGCGITEPSGKLDQVLDKMSGQVFCQVEEFVNQCSIRRKDRLVKILDKIFCQVWNRAKSKTDVAALSISTIDVLSVLIGGEMTVNQIAVCLNIDSQKDKRDIRRLVIAPLLSLGIIEMTLPDKPTSSRQAYRLTKNGRELFEEK